MLLEVINSIERTPSQETTKRAALYSLSIMFDSDILVSQSRNFSLHSVCQRSLLPHIFTSFCRASAKWREGSFVHHRQKFSIQFHCYLLLFSSKLCICTTFLRSSRVEAGYLHCLYSLFIMSMAVSLFLGVSNTVLFKSRPEF